MKVSCACGVVAAVLVCAADGFISPSWARPHLRHRRETLQLLAATSRSSGGDGGAKDGDSRASSPRVSGSDAARELERFFFDQCDLFVKSGRGGAGALSSNGGRPAGGHGGRGGDVVLECSADYNSLSHLPGKRYHGEQGHDAVTARKGADGAPCVLLVPPNVMVKRSDTNETLAVLAAPGERLVVCQGGAGGKGNGQKSNPASSGMPDKVAPPKAGQKLPLQLEMTLVADVGLVGYPNAGKSTLLRAVSKARPKVANYPFTTLVPNLGVCEPGRFRLDPGLGMVWLDIPGLVEGAAEGRGLGLAFLRHAERCRVLLHLVDGEAPDPAASLRAINAELAAFSPGLAATPQAVVLTKVDLPHVAARRAEMLAALRKEAARHRQAGGRVACVSAADGTNLRELLVGTHKLLERVEGKQKQQMAAVAAARVKEVPESTQPPRDMQV